jgi:transposase
MTLPKSSWNRWFAPEQRHNEWRRRCRVILLAREGISNHSIAKQLGLSRPTVIAARATFDAGGVPALTAKPTRNRLRRTLTPELEKKMLPDIMLLPVFQMSGER